MKSTIRPAVWVLILLSAFVSSCKKEKKPQTQEWYRYISAYTSGAVSRQAHIRVLFVGNVGT
ncbi:MAG TPA: hypothetical protein VLQ89_04165, partial [Candidatus Binatia bacterium]|nr:hypothetical protein [Candidatus Binatia bacterium]